MQWFVAGNDTLTKATDPHVLEHRVPGMQTSLEAAQDLRQFYKDTGTEGNLGNGWKHVATVHGPVMAVAQLLDPQWLNSNGKKTFYSWIDRHTGYLAYDRRAAMAKRPFFGWEAPHGTTPDQESPA